MTKSVRTRIAPSPTGLLHIGTARSALYNFLFARKHRGKFILRIEDTDRERSRKEYEADIIESLNWLSLTQDESYRQSERTLTYKKYLKKLIELNRAYISKEGGGEVIRLRNPGKEITFNDLIRGNITFDTEELGDLVIARTLESPLYHLAVVIDDHEMNISHVIRGEDHISNTPRQILIQEACGFERPFYAHIPLILAKDRSKLSKREGGFTVAAYKEAGYLPEAVVNYLAFLGWSPENDREIFRLEELIETFDLSRIHRGSAAFDEEKLKWFNSEYVKGINDKEFVHHTLLFIPDSILKLPQYSKERLLKMVPILKERIRTFSDIEKMAENSDLAYYFRAPEYEREGLSHKERAEPGAVLSHLTFIQESTENIPEDNWNEASVRNAVWNYAGEKGRGEVLWPMRFALSGKEKSPDPFTLAYVLGRKETIARISSAIEKLQ